MDGNLQKAQEAANKAKASLLTQGKVAMSVSGLMLFGVATSLLKKDYIAACFFGAAAAVNFQFRNGFRAAANYITAHQFAHDHVTQTGNAPTSDNVQAMRQAVIGTLFSKNKLPTDVN